jgi:glycosyltransferase involved in cell wall biosynthesis
MTAPRVSVCVATYNRAALLRRCLDSLLAQTVSGFELVVVDNASSDETAETVRACADPRLRYVRNPENLGSRGNWNRCLEVSGGEYVAICHDDDTYAPAFVERGVDFLDRHPSVGFVHCAAIVTDAYGTPTGRFGAARDDRVLPSREAFWRFLLESHDVVLSSVMARRAAYEAAGPFRPQFLCADYDMWLRIAARFDVGYIGAPLVNYRVHAESTAQRMPAGRWYEEHVTIVSDGLALAGERFGRLEAPREAVLERVRRRWCRRYVREALSRISRGNLDRAREYLTAAGALATEPAWRRRVALARLLLSAPSAALLRTLRVLRAATRHRGSPPGAAMSLYISYDGILEPLGQTQLLPYVRALSRTGISFVLLTFEKPADLARRADVAALRDELAGDAIRWIALRYHKRPPVAATAWDVLRGVATGAGLARRYGARVVHCRSYVAGVIGAAVRAVSPVRLVFDMRGFWPEERVDGGLWPASGRLFRLAKRVERLLFRKSDAVIVLTERAAHILEAEPYRHLIAPGTPVTVIPCCVDVRRFDAVEVPAEARDGEGGRTLVYAGSVGTWYLLEEMLEFFAVARARDPRLRFLILNRGEHEAIRHAVASRALDGVTVAAAAPAEIPAHLAAAHAGIYFIRPVFSKLGASPTKLGEYLAAGLPVVVNAGVGDADELVRAARVGVVVERFDRDEYLAKWSALVELVAGDPALRRRCRQTARDTLALERGVERYRQVYRRLLATGPPPGVAGGEPRAAPRLAGADGR